MGWFDRAAERNQRRAQRDNDRYRSEAADNDDASVAEAAGAYGSFLPGWIGVLGAAVFAVSGALRLRRRSSD